MHPRSLGAILRTLADAHAPASDVELLRRFLADDETAFAELVKRHGRLVWAACRNLTNSDADADDAFQATFLVLLKNAKKVRDAGKLSAWLHGVAYKVCGKTRQGAKRRTTREQATAHREGNGTVVPESAWDRALAAVHEEAARLPETLRVPFVLCCLEGKGVTEAAEQLGWKLGTLSGRLTRAKDAVLAKLDARGLTLGVVAAVGLAVPPAAAVAKASALAHVGSVIPGSILQLTQGVIGMSMTTVKMLAATVLLTCGLGLSVGTGWVATADAQQPAKVKPSDDVKRLQAELERARAQLAAEQAKLAEQRAKQAIEAEQAARAAAEKLRQVEGIAFRRVETRGKGSAPSFKTAKWEYSLVPVRDHQDNFGPFLQEQENAGWEFLGLGAPESLLFRRQVKGDTVRDVFIQRPGMSVAETLEGYRYYVPSQPAVPPVTTWAIEGKPGAMTVRPVIAHGGVTNPAGIVQAVRPPATGDDPKVIEIEIKRLTEKLTELKAKKSAAVAQATFASSLDAATLRTVLVQLVAKKFGKETKFEATVDGGTVRVSGDSAAIEWAAGVVKALGGK